jgi:hypothetical protein
MTNSQYYGWSREDAAPLNQPATPRKSTWLSRRLDIMRNDYDADSLMREFDAAIADLQRTPK